VPRLPSLPRLANRDRSAGFTLVELLIVLAMIALLVVIASPTSAQLMRDRRVSRAGSMIVDYFRTARTMAIGRGQPMLVSWNSAGSGLANTNPGGTGYLEVDEPIVGALAMVKTYMSPSCDQVAWRTAGVTRPMTSFQFDIQNGNYNNTSLAFYDESGNTAAGADICFSPVGRMYMRTGAAGAVTGAFTVVMGVPAFAVFNTSTNPTLALSPGGVGSAGARWVFLMPNGTARVQL
jgi:type IV fimbrial biogenesis protein FimT